MVLHVESDTNCSHGGFFVMVEATPKLRKHECVKQMGVQNCSMRMHGTGLCQHWAKEIGEPWNCFGDIGPT